MFRSPLNFDEGILLVQGRESRIDSAIHMFFMRMDLAVVWVSKTFEVVDVKLAKRWQPMIFPNRPAKYILEIAAGRISEFTIGDFLYFEEPNLD